MVPRFPLFLAFLLFSSPALAAIHGTVERELTTRQLEPAATDQSEGRIASDGTSFLTVWSDDSIRILGARLDQDGSLLDLTPLAIGSGTRTWHPAVAWGADRYLVAWHTHDSILGRFVAPGGTMAETFQIATHAPREFPEELHVAFDGRVFLVTWWDDEVYRGTIVDLDGRVLATREVVRAWVRNTYDLVVMDGTFHFVYATLEGVFVVPIDSAGNAGNTIEVAKTTEAIGVRASSLLVGWWTSHEIHSARVTSGSVEQIDAFPATQHVLHDVVDDLLVYSDGGRLLARRAGSNAPFAVPAPKGELPRVEDAATNGVETIALVRRFSDFRGDLFASDLVSRVAPVALAPRAQVAPDAAAAGELRLAVWREERTLAGRRAVVAMRFDANGNAIDGAPVDTGGTTGVFAGPRVASNGTDWLVVWSRDTFVEGVRIRRDGTLLDAAPLRIADQVLADEVAVAWDGTSYVVVFVRGAYLRTSLSSRVFAARVPASGEPAAPFAVSGSGWHWQVAIASGAEGSLIVWTAYDRLRGALLSRGDAVTTLSFLDDPARRPAAAWNRDAFVIVSGTWLPELRITLVDAHGNARESTARIDYELQAYSGYDSLEVEPFGDAFLVLWPEQTLRAAIVNRDGFVADGPATVGKTLRGYQRTFGAAGGLVVTQHPIEHPTLSSRVFVQSIQWTPQARPKQRSARF